MNLQRKIDFAINLLRSIPQDGPIELSYSGGKDSDIILQLAKESGIPFEAIYKNTTIDPPGTIAHCKENGVTILQPKLSFFQLIEKKGFPNRWRRFCCEQLKEYKVYDRAIHGIRRCESTKRAARYNEPEICRVYGKDKARVYLPILEWTDEDCLEFIEDRKIKCAPRYYDNEGNFHIERRLGCIGCPLANMKKRVEDFTQYPKMLKLWCEHGQVYMENHKNGAIYRNFQGNAYNFMFFNLFSDKYAFMEEYKAIVTGGLFPDAALDTRKYLSDYFKIKL